MTAEMTTAYTPTFTATCHVCGVLTEYVDSKRVDGRCDHQAGVIYDIEPTDDDLDELLGMSDRTFSQVVADEVREEASPRHAAALRDDELLDRWGQALLDLTFVLDAQLSEKKHIKDPETRAWRRAALRFRGGVQVRREECKLLTKERNKAESEQRAAEAHARRLRRIQEKEARIAKHTPAVDRALERLIGAHRGEFSRYLIEEHEVDGLPVKDRWVEEAGAVTDTSASASYEAAP